MGQDVEEGRLVGGRYRLEGVLGRGGMGTVWRGRDETLGRPVAVKELRFPSSVDDEERQRLITRTRREAKAIARIRSGSAITVFDVVDEDDRPWIVMEIVEGCSLAERIRQDGPLTPRRAAQVGLAVLDVLRAAHREGILHRDVKPSNVLLEDGTERVVLTDFGIAKVEGDPSVTSTGMLVGAPSYISPERARGKPPGPPADLWSLGGLLYAAVEGRPPYDKGAALATLTAVMTEPLPAPRKAAELTDVLYGLLEKDPVKRLDVDGAHALLAAVASGAAAVPEAADPTRTVILPPVPEDEGTGEAEGDAVEGAAAASGASSRKTSGDSGSSGSRAEAAAGAAVQPAGADTEAGGSGTGAVTAGAGGPALVSRDGGAAPRDGGAPATWRSAVSRRTLAVAGAIVAMLLVVGAVLALGDDGGDGGGGTGGTGEGGSSAGQEPGKDDSAKGGGKSDDGGSPAPDPSTSQDTGPTGDDDAPGGDDGGDDDQQDGGLPDGYAVLKDSRFHFAMAMPKGFERYGIAGTGSGGKYAGPDRGYPQIQVDYTGDPGDDAVAAWEAADPLSTQGYKRISIKEVDNWRDYPTVADWVFEFEAKGTRYRAVNRGFVVDKNRGHAIVVTCRADAWDGEACTTMRETAFRTFDPR